MLDIFKGAGLLIYPLGICSIVAVFIICERLYALRKAAILPDDLVDAIVQGKPASGGKHSVLARVLAFAHEHAGDPDAVKAEIMSVGFMLDGEGNALANPADEHTKLVFDPAVRGRTDRFLYRFRKPR